VDCELRNRNLPLVENEHENISKVPEVDSTVVELTVMIRAHTVIMFAQDNDPASPLETNFTWWASTYHSPSGFLNVCGL
jgi:hypothetical protein